MRNGIVLLLMVSGIAWGAGSSPHSTTTQLAINRAPAAPLPERFQILLSRSIFARTGASAARSTPAASEAVPALALRGIVLKDGVYIAMMEDAASHRIQTVSEDGALAGGRVSHMTLRGFDYEVGGKKVPVTIGRNLQGEPAVLMPTTAPNVTSVAQGAPAPPIAAPPGSESPGTPSNAVQASASNDAAAGTTAVADGNSVGHARGPSKRHAHSFDN